MCRKTDYRDKAKAHILKTRAQLIKDGIISRRPSDPPEEEE